MGKFQIKRVTHGKLKGQFRIKLIGDNGEVIAVGETYTQKHNALELREKYFSQFELIDLSLS